MIILYIVVYMLIAWATTYYIYFIMKNLLHKGHIFNSEDKQFCAFIAMLWPIMIPMSIVYLILNFTSVLLAKGLK